MLNYELLRTQTQNRDLEISNLAINKSQSNKNSNFILIKPYIR